MDDADRHADHGDLRRAVLWAAPTGPSCPDHPFGCQYIALVCACGLRCAYHAGRYANLPQLTAAIDRLIGFGVPA